MITHSSSGNFNSSGCLTPQAIRHYLEGTMKMSDRLAVEEHVRRCRLCSEALKGFKKHQRKNLLRSDMELLNKRVRQQYAGENPTGPYRMPIIVVISLIVLLFLLIGIFLVIRQFQSTPVPGPHQPDSSITVPDHEVLQVETVN